MITQRFLYVVASVALAACGSSSEPAAADLPDDADIDADIDAADADGGDDIEGAGIDAADADEGADIEGDDIDGDDIDGDDIDGAGTGILEQAESGALGGGRATVDLNGITYEFARVDGAMTVCTESFGTLQVLLPLLDPETGDALDGPELNLVVLQDGEQIDDRTPKLYIEVGTFDTGDWYAGQSFFADLYDDAGGDPEPIEARANGSSFTATVTLALTYDASQTADATIDVQCS